MFNVICIHIDVIYVHNIIFGRFFLNFRPHLNQISVNPMVIALILKELRTIKKASQQQIADKLNIERSTYTKWETGQVMLRVDQLQEIANLYGIDFEFMARCIEAGKLVSQNDVERYIYLQEQKELRGDGGGG